MKLTKFIGALCLIVPLVAFSQTNEKNSVYVDSCNLLLEKVDIVFHTLETNEFTKNLFTEADKDKFKNERGILLKRLSTSSKSDQKNKCDSLLERYDHYIQSFNTIKSEEDTLDAFPPLRK